MFEHVDQIVETITSPRTLWIVLWSGLAVLTIALLIVTRTKWGQAQPTSKCVVLSVFAHLLLLGYAYKTELFAIYPSDVASKSIRVNIVSNESVLQRNDSGQDEPRQWERFANLEAPDIEQPRLERSPVTDASDDRQREIATIDLDTGFPVQDAAGESPTRDTPDEPTNALTNPDRNAAGATPIKAIPRARNHRTVEEIPHARSPARNPIPLVVSDAARQANVPTIGPRKQDVAQQVERLAEIPNVDELAEIHADDRDSSANLRSDVEGETLSRVADNSPSAAQSHRQLPSPVSATPIASVQSSGDESAAKSAAISGDGPVDESKSVTRRGASLPDVYRPRLEQDRDENLQRSGGSVVTETAVEGGLKWLAAHQNRDGSWDAGRFGAGRETRVFGHDRRGAGTNADSGVTGLAVLAMLGAGNTHYRGKYRKNVQHGLEYLLSLESGGNLAGDAGTFAMMYCHGISLFAVCEAFAMTGDDRMKPYVQRAVNYSLQAQNSVDGGWRYQPGDEGDMSQFGWQVMALKSAELAGLTIPDSARTGMQRFLRRCSSGEHGGLAAYRPNERPTRTMTAEALLCRIVLETDTREPKIQEAKEYLVGQLPGNGRANLYYWYYATLALHGMGGDAWQQWNAALQRELIHRQRNDGALAGSWDADTVWGGYGGRVYSTSMATMCLEVYYRYLPPTLDFRGAHADPQQTADELRR